MNVKLWLFWLVVIVIGGSLIGAGGGAGFLALGLGLVGILWVTLSGGRPTRRGKGLGTRRLPFLGRFRAPAAGDLPSILLAGMAGGTLLVTMAAPVELQLLLAAVFGIALGAIPSAAGAVLAAGGTTAALIGALGDPDCALGLTSGAVGAFVAVVLLGTVAFIIGRIGLLGLRAPLQRNRSIGDWALLGFGLTSLALFVAAPEGLEIWTDAHPIARPVALLLVVVITGAAAYAPELVAALVAIAVFGGAAALGVAAATSGGSQLQCGTTSGAVVPAIVTLVVASMVGSASRPKAGVP